MSYGYSNGPARVSSCVWLEAGLFSEVLVRSPEEPNEEGHLQNHPGAILKKVRSK